MNLSHFLKQMRASYSAKLIAIFIAALCLMATALNITSNRMQKSSYTKYMQSNGLALAQLLANSVQLDVFSENLEQLRIPEASLMSREEIHHVEILTSKGLPLVSLGKTQKSNQIPDRAALLTEIRAQASHFKEWPTTFSYWWPVKALATTSSEDALYFDVDPAQTGEEQEPLGYVTLLVSKIHYEKDIREMAIRSGLIILLLLILLVTGTLLLTRRMTLPLRTLIHKIQSQRTIGEDHDEIGLLDTTVTNLIKDLDHSFETINNLKTGLENKVEERTKQLALANQGLTTRQEYLEEANQQLEKAMQELQETEGQLIQSEKMAALGQVVAGVAHEINNNINFISAALPSLSRGINDLKELTRTFGAACLEEPGEKQAKIRLKALALKKELEKDDLFSSLDELMGNIREGVKRTIRIVTDLHTFSRADEQGFKRVDLHSSLDSTLTFVNKKYLKGIHIHQEYGTIPLVTCRPGRLNQVFLNIMNNGIQAMARQGGTLKITTFLDDDHVHIRFSDTGCGISKEVLPKIFDPFFTSKGPGAGTGIGLAVSYKIIQEHRGRITVTSREGEGSIFDVILPVDGQKEALPPVDNSAG
ncbi:MAG: ATP-binding protein [Deltaproteobacteria bacterium]|jgi:signal transduction histidine kinase|nr:ATP-binding protein [Deltaproteobacteria bacterium]